MLARSRADDHSHSSATFMQASRNKMARPSADPSDFLKKRMPAEFPLAVDF
jgi:hypothetical protein